MATILAVDDTEANIDILVEALGDDHDVGVAMSGEDALEYLEDELPDLILLDIMMPGMDGFEVCRRLKADDRTKDIPIVFLSAMTGADEKQKGLDLGAVDFITKPIDPAALQQTVARVTGS